MKLATLHIGSHKTATTSVQRWLLANPSMLAEQGIDYPNLRDVVPTAVDFTQWDLIAAIAAVRRPDLYLRSLFNQAVKHRSWSSTADDMRGWFNDFSDEHWHLAQYDRHLEVRDAASAPKT